jgi:ABC-2 type transport system permease protein
VSENASGASARWRRICGLIWKEVHQIRRDPSTIIIAGILPLILIVLFGYGVSFDARSIRVGLVMETSTPESNRFAASLRGYGVFSTTTVRQRMSFDKALAAGQLDAIVVLPADLSRQMKRGEAAPVQIIVDGSDANNAALVLTYVQGAWASWTAAEALVDARPEPPRVSLNPRIWFNTELASHHYLVPGSMAIILTLIGSLLTALVIAREWERGTMEALLATPVEMVELLIGKLVPYFALGMGSMVLSSAAAIYVFEVPFRGSFWVLGLTSGVFLLAALGQGLLISTATRSQFVASQGAILSAFMPALYFSGFVFEIDSMPWPLPWLTYIVPARYFIASLQSEFLAGDVWSVIAPDLLAMAAIAAVLLALTVLNLNKRLE